MLKLPLSRQSDLVVQQLENEILIFDIKINQAYCLNETSARVYQACDGLTSFDQLKLRHQLSDDIIYLALDQLNNQNLLEENVYQSPFSGMSRRAVIRQVGFASLITLPVVYSIIAPSAVSAQSLTNLPLLAACSAPSQCTSGNCKNNSICCVPGNINANPPGQGTSATAFGGDCATLTQSDLNSQCNSSFSPTNCCSGNGFVAGVCTPFNQNGLVQTTCSCA